MDEARFLNVDLELESAADLSPLAAHFGERVLVLLNQRVGQSYRLALETWESFSPPGERDADACIQGFLTLLATLPPPLRALWAGCRARTFDVGVSAGPTPPASTQVLSPATLAEIAALDAAVRLTIYAPQDPGLRAAPNTTLEPTLTAGDAPSPGHAPRPE